MPLRFRIVADASNPIQPGGRDPIADQQYASYAEAYDVLERYYADLCCSDERLFYRIVDTTEAEPSQAEPSKDQGIGAG